MDREQLTPGRVHRLDRPWRARLRPGNRSAHGTRISIVIPTVSGVSEATLKSLPRVHEVIVVDDPDQRGAPWARNLGIEAATGELLFCCDDDVEIQPRALDGLARALDRNPETSFSYGYYLRGDEEVGRQVFDAELLRHHNYISTMSLVRATAEPRFDEDLARFQDWDLWLTLVERGLTGVFIDELIFTTDVRPGITFDGSATLADSTLAIMTKHGLPIDEDRIAAERALDEGQAEPEQEHEQGAADSEPAA